jgi:ElaB/YqjD/DUF883 family membrane-anchored ribosome-binding protein
MATQNVDAELTALKGDLADLRKDLQSLVKTFKDEQKAVGKEALGRLQDGAHQAKAELGRLAGEAGARGRESIHALETHIEERPFTSVLAAFGIGLILGKLLDR